jgi:UDP-glucose 4-epimerase
MKYVVIGGAGFIGSHMVDLLNIHGDVVIIDDLSTGRIENVPKYYIHKNDVSYLNKKTNEILLDADYVFYFAAKARVQPSIVTPLPYHRVNVNGLLNVLESLRHSTKLQKFVFSSSSSVYGNQESFPIPEHATKNPSSPYALQKLIGEQYIKLYADLYKVPSVSLRYFNVFGNRMPREGAYTLLIGKWMNLIEQGKPIEINGDGTQLRDFTFVEDVVNANLRVALEDKIVSGEAFNIGGGNPLSVNEVAEIFQKVTNCQKINLPPVIEPYITHADNRKAKKLLGWSPTVRLEDWLTIYIESVL